MAWFYLFIAGIFEIGWPVGFKLTALPGLRWMGWGMAIGSLILSAIFLWLAQREIPIGTAYAVWTGFGAAGTFLIGVYFFNEPASLMRYFGVVLIVSGAIMLKLAA